LRRTAEEDDSKGDTKCNPTEQVFPSPHLRKETEFPKRGLYLFIIPGDGKSS
jgi:hypothetical protein